MRRILYICRKSIHYFKELDYRFLSEEYDVTRFYFTYSPLCILKLFIEIKKHDLSFCWFGNIWAFFAVLFSKFWGKKSVVVAGGHDVANMPEINYGLRQNRIMKHFARFAFTFSDLVLPVSFTAKQRLLEFTIPKRTRTIYNAVVFSPPPTDIVKKKQVLTVGMVDALSSLVKGHFVFIEVARYLPDIRFILCGQHKDGTIHKLQKKAPKNVEFIDHSTRESIFNLYSESMIYAQLSYDESFGVAVAEAMSYGCIPVVTNCGALPEIVGDTGLILQESAPKQIAEQMRQILRTPSVMNRKAMQRANIFSAQKRKSRLISEIKMLFSS